MAGGQGVVQSGEFCPYHLQDSSNWARNTGSEHLRFAAASQVPPLQTGNPNNPLWITGSAHQRVQAQEYPACIR